MAQRKPQRKTAIKTDSRRATTAPIDQALGALANRLTGATPIKHGSIVLRCTDSGEEYRVEGGGGAAARVRSGAEGGAGPVRVRISGPSAVLAAVMAGKQEASSAFIAGGLQVSGDLSYLESLLKELGLLNCQ